MILRDIRVIEFFAASRHVDVQFAVLSVFRLSIYLALVISFSLCLNVKGETKAKIGVSKFKNFFVR